MATEIVNTYETYGATGLREELADRIWMITPEETPFTSLIGKRSVVSTHPEWQTDTLATPDLTNNQPEGSDWTGARGFVHEVAKAHFDGNFSGHQAYLCGPPVMIEACISTLMQGRLFERDIYTEKFLSAADTNQ